MSDRPNIITAPDCVGGPWDCGALTIEQLLERGRAGRCCVLADLDALPEVVDADA